MANESSKAPAIPQPQLIPLAKIHDLPGARISRQPDKSYGGLVTSIQMGGVKEPVILRLREDGEYQIVTGYRRRHASELAKKQDMGKLSAERFEKLSEGYEKEQAELKASVDELRPMIGTAETQAINIQSFLKVVKKYTEPTELTPALLHEFVNKIVVHAPDKSSGHRVQRIDVHYNFIGEIDLSPEYSKKTTA